MIFTLLTLSSFCLPHCHPGFSCFHSLGENTHLASNHGHSSLIDSQIEILFYSTPLLISCSEQSCFLVYWASQSPICNHNLLLSPSQPPLLSDFLSVFFSSLFSQFFSIFLSHIDAHTHTYQFKLTLSNFTSSKALFMMSFLASRIFQLNLKHNFLPQLLLSHSYTLCSLILFTNASST